MHSDTLQAHIRTRKEEELNLIKGSGEEEDRILIGVSQSTATTCYKLVLSPDKLRLIEHPRHVIDFCYIII